MRNARSRRQQAGQLALFHGAMSADVQSALRRVQTAMERVSDEDMARRRARWEALSGLIDGNISGRRR